MGFTYQEANNQGILMLDGDLTLSQAEELRMFLIKAIINVDELVLELGDVNDVDLTCLQLLCSVHRSAVRMNKRVAFAGQLPVTFSKVVRDAGYKRGSGCHLDRFGGCLWVKR
jgi:ABC-type transporter Mla MlaB component